jgi:hypothetical protein
LKSKYGQGYELMLKMNNGGDVTEALVLITSEISKKAIVLEKGGDNGYVRLGLGQVKTRGEDGDFQLSVAFGVMEKNKERLRIESFSLSQSGLEEVFLNITKKSKRKPEEV